MLYNRQAAIRQGKIIVKQVFSPVGLIWQILLVFGQDVLVQPPDGLDDVFQETCIWLLVQYFLLLNVTLIVSVLPKVIHFVLISFTAAKFLMQKFCSPSNCFCRPAHVSDISTRSSAHNKCIIIECWWCCCTFQICRGIATSLGANARGCRPTPSSRWRRTLSSPRLITGKLTDTAHLLETHTSWGYCRWYEEHWGGVSSRDKQSFSRYSYLKSCVVMRVMHISVFPVSRVTVFHVEGDATVDEGDACLIGQTVIDISRFHVCCSCLFCPLFNITRFKTQ